MDWIFTDLQKAMTSLVMIAAIFAAVAVAAVIALMVVLRRNARSRRADRR